MIKIFSMSKWIIISDKYDKFDKSRVPRILLFYNLSFSSESIPVIDPRNTSK